MWIVGRIKTQLPILVLLLINDQGELGQVICLWASMCSPLESEEIVLNL